MTAKKRSSSSSSKHHVQTHLLCGNLKYIEIKFTFIQKLGQSINHSMRTRKSGEFQNRIHHPKAQVQLNCVTGVFDQVRCTGLRQFFK